MRKALTDNIENVLATSVKTLAKWGFGLSRKEILELVGQFVSKNDIETPFKDGIPGEDCSESESDASEWMEEEDEQREEDEQYDSDKENNESRKTPVMKNKIGRVGTEKVKEVAKEQEKEEIRIERDGSHETATKDQEIEQIETEKTRTEEKTEKRIEENNWVIVKYALKKGLKYYVGVIKKQVGPRWEVKFVRRKGSMFVWPLTEDVDQITADSIVQILPNPELTKRGLITFDFKFRNMVIS